MLLLLLQASQQLDLSPDQANTLASDPHDHGQLAAIQHVCGMSQKVTYMTCLYSNG